MEDEFKSTTNPRDPNCYGAQHAARPGVPPANAADDTAFAILKLMQTKPRRRMLLNQRRGFSDGVQGILYYNPRGFGLTWVFDGYQMKRGELNSIEDAFEGFINNLEWEDE
jgi:hypothetical protein